MQQTGKALTVPIDLMGAPKGFNPTLALLVSSIILAGVSTTGYWAWNWAHWFVFLCNFVSLYVLGTVIHDASHGVAHRNRTVNAAIGHVSAVLQGFVFPVFTRVHLQHHAHVRFYGRSSVVDCGAVLLPRSIFLSAATVARF